MEKGASSFLASSWPTKPMDSLFTVALNFFSSLWKCFPSLALWWLAGCSQWLQTVVADPKLQFPLILNNEPIFARETSGSLLISGQQNPGCDQCFFPCATNWSFQQSTFTQDANLKCKLLPVLWPTICKSDFHDPSLDLINLLENLYWKKNQFIFIQNLTMAIAQERASQIALRNCYTAPKG